MRQCLLTESKQNPKLEPKLRDNSGVTPALIMGVERRITMVDLAPNAKENRPYGLYGNNFKLASHDAIKKATQKLDPPTITNLIGMVAPKYGHGEYSFTQIKEIFTTAYTSFLAARIESYMSQESNKVKVVIHTGNWGTGKKKCWKLIHSV